MTLSERKYALLWTYLRGLAVVLVFLALVQLVRSTMAPILEWLAPLFESTSSAVWKTALVLLVFVVLPLVVGSAISYPLQFFRNQRATAAFGQMEERLGAELTEGEGRGYRVAIIEWPSKGVRTLGVVASTFREPESGREMAAVYVPGAPDPTKGRLHVVAVEDLMVTDWSVSDLARYQVTLGSASPTSVDFE